MTAFGVVPLERVLTTGLFVLGERMDTAAIAEAGFLHCGCLTRGIHFPGASRPSRRPKLLLPVEDQPCP